VYFVVMDSDDDLALVGPEQLAGLLSVSRSTMSRMIRAGELPPPRLLAGRRPRWRRTELERWWQQQPRATADLRTPDR
jgi:excisionase family DNA binding protein